MKHISITLLSTASFFVSQGQADGVDGYIVMWQQFDDMQHSSIFYQLKYFSSSHLVTRCLCIIRQ